MTILGSDGPDDDELPGTEFAKEFYAKYDIKETLGR